MSTRCNIIIKDEIFNDSLIFYRHSDGYPSGTLPTLKKFMQWVVSGQIRDNVEQSAGWLILIGAKEYGKKYVKNNKTGNYEYQDKKDVLSPDPSECISGWKCGAYEPATSIHCDIEYLYILNLTKKTIEVQEVMDNEKCEYRTIKTIHCDKVKK